MTQQFERNPIILTGGPGGGKSTLLKALVNRGFYCVDEVARDLIQEEVKAGGDALPWRNAEKFRDNMFWKQLQVIESLHHDGIVFFDRGLIDCLAYSKLIGIGIPDEMVAIAKSTPFYSTVFVTPPWKEIYQTDTERKQSFEEAVQTYHQIISTYQEYGYETVDLPKVDAEERVDFILKSLR